MSLVGVRLNVINVENKGVGLELGSSASLVSLFGGDKLRHFRSLIVSRSSGGLFNLPKSVQDLQSMCDALEDRPIGEGKQRRDLHISPVISKVLQGMVMKSNSLSYGKPVPVSHKNPKMPVKEGSFTERLLAGLMVWLEVLGCQYASIFLIGVISAEKIMLSELMQEAKHICNSVVEDVVNCGLKLRCEDGELSELCHQFLSPRHGKMDFAVTRAEVGDLITTMFFGELGSLYQTNDYEVYAVYSAIKHLLRCLGFTEGELCTDITNLDYVSRVQRSHLKNPLPFGGYPENSIKPELRVTACPWGNIWGTFWELNDLSSLDWTKIDFRKKMEELASYFRRAIVLEPKAGEKVLGWNVQPIRLSQLVGGDVQWEPEKDAEEVLEKYLAPVLQSFSPVARVVAFSSVFTGKDLETLASKGNYGYGKEMLFTEMLVSDTNPEVKRMDIKRRAVAVALMKTLVEKMTTISDCGDLQLIYTPALLASSGQLGQRFNQLLDNHTTIPLWHGVLLCGWLLNAYDCAKAEKRSDIANCIGLSGSRISLILKGAIIGSDDDVQNCLLSVMVGSIVDVPRTSDGLILVDDLVDEEGMKLKLNFTENKEVQPESPDADICVDLGPSFESDKQKIRLWLRSGGMAFGSINPLKASMAVCRGRVPCTCRKAEQGTHRGQVIKVSTIVEAGTRVLGTHWKDEAAPKLVLMAHNDPIWRFCLAGIYHKNNPVLSTVCSACAEAASHNAKVLIT